MPSTRQSRARPLPRCRCRQLPGRYSGTPGRLIESRWAVTIDDLSGPRLTTVHSAIHCSLYHRDTETDVSDTLCNRDDSNSSLIHLKRPGKSDVRECRVRKRAASHFRYSANIGSEIRLNKGIYQGTDDCCNALARLHHRKYSCKVRNCRHISSEVGRFMFNFTTDQ